MDAYLSPWIIPVGHHPGDLWSSFPKSLQTPYPVRLHAVWWNWEWRNILKPLKDSSVRNGINPCYIFSIAAPRLVLGKPWQAWARRAINTQRPRHNKITSKEPGTSPQTTTFPIRPLLSEYPEYPEVRAQVMTISIFWGLTPTLKMFLAPNQICVNLGYFRPSWFMRRYQRFEYGVSNCLYRIRINGRSWMSLCRNINTE